MNSDSLWGYIIAAYSVAAIALVALAVWRVRRYRDQRRKLDES